MIFVVIGDSSGWWILLVPPTLVDRLWTAEDPDGIRTNATGRSDRARPPEHGGDGQDDDGLAAAIRHPAMIPAPAPPAGARQTAVVERFVG